MELESHLKTYLSIIDFISREIVAIHRTECRPSTLQNDLKPEDIGSPRILQTGKRIEPLPQPEG